MPRVLPCHLLGVILPLLSLQPLPWSGSHPPLVGAQKPSALFLLQPLASVVGPQPTPPPPRGSCPHISEGSGQHPQPSWHCVACRIKSNPTPPWPSAIRPPGAFPALLSPRGLSSVPACSEICLWCFLIPSPVPHLLVLASQYSSLFRAIEKVSQIASEPLKATLPCPQGGC